MLCAHGDSGRCEVDPGACIGEGRVRLCRLSSLIMMEGFNLSGPLGRDSSSDCNSNTARMPYSKVCEPDMSGESQPGRRDGPTVGIAVTRPLVVTSFGSP